MTRHTHRSSLFALSIVIALVAPTGITWAMDDALAVEVRGGTATFDVATNLSAISVHGKSTALTGRARIRPGASGLMIEQLQAVVPVETLNTGMSLRDHHMRKYVFTTPEGKVPDLVFSAESAMCQGTEMQGTCQVGGELTVRGTARPFTITLKVAKEGGAFRAVGDGTLKLSAYGIAQPSQLGVTTEDVVKLHLDFVARAPESTLAGDR